MANKKTGRTITYVGSGYKALGQIDSESPEAMEIGRNIHQAIKGIPEKLANEALDKIKQKVSLGENGQALGILKENAFFLRHIKDKQALQVIESINTNDLSRDSKKDHLLYTLAVASRIDDLPKVIQLIEKLETEFKEDLDENYRHGFTLEKARFAQKEGKRSVAVLHYQQLTNMEGVSARDAAVAYQGLAELSGSKEDTALYCKFSADKFLEAGITDGAIANLMELSRLQALRSPRAALESIETCLSLAGSDELFDKHTKANLLQDKADYLDKIGEKHDALLAIEEAIRFDQNVFGAEINLHRSFLIASELSAFLGLDEKRESYREKAKQLESTIDDELFKLRIKVSNYYECNEKLNAELLNEVMQSGDSSFISAVLLKESTSSSNTLIETVNLLENALRQLEKRDNNEISSLIHFHFGLVYQEQGMVTEAEESYKKSLNKNPYNYPAANNLASIYFENKLWEKAENFFSNRIELLGELPNMCFGYGKALYERKKYSEALYYLNKANQNMSGLKELKDSCINHLPTTVIESNFTRTVVQKITSDNLLEALRDFSETVSSQSRMYFWKSDGKGEHKWAANPEEIGKQLLITFLHAKFGRDNLEVIQEAQAGAGYIDLYLLLAGGLKVVIELKMCGAPYSSSYAISGEHQIIHYQTNKNCNLGYLIVFDGRKRDFGKGFKEVQVIDNKTIYSIAVDVQSKI